MDEILGTNKSDTFNLGATDDTVYAGNGKDVVYAGGGNDAVYGENGNDVLLGQAGDDDLFGGNGDDVVIGGADNDTLSGGRGDDTFAFNFTVKEIVTTNLITETFAGTQPTDNSNHNAWLSYEKNLDKWLVEMDGLHGGDLVAGDNLFSKDLTWTETVKVGKTSQTTTYTQTVDGDRNYTYAVTSTELKLQGEGHDTVIDWGNGEDKLLLKGLSADTSAVNYWGSWLNSEDNQDGQSVISFDGGSITLIGTDMTLADLVAGGHVQFG